MSAPSADLDAIVVEEIVLGQHQIARRRALADAPGGVVHRAVARAEPAAIGTPRIALLLAERDAAEMRAHADHDQPFRLLGALLVRRRVLELGHRHLARLLDLLRRSMIDEHRLAAPFHGDALAD